MIRHHVLYIELPHKLEFMTMQYTREPYYKDEASEFYAGGDKKILLVYGGRDAAVTFEIFNKQEEELQ